MISLASFIVLMPLLAGGYLTGSPADQKACYALDRDATRTARFITAARLTGKIAPAITLASDGKGYWDVKFSAIYKMLAFPEQWSTFTVGVPEEFFTNEFLGRLQQSGETYVSRDFKMKYVRSEAGCELVYIFDIDTSRSAGSAPPPENLQMWGCIQTGVPALGATRIDMTGQLYGVNLRIGSDYTSDSSHCAAE